LKSLLFETKEKIQKHIIVLECVLTQDGNAKDKFIHQQSLETLRESLVALNSVGKPKTAPTKKIIELREFGMTQEKIAQTLGVSLSTVRRELKSKTPGEQ
jgi:DNA-binding transcriptional regulator YiaG